MYDYRKMTPEQREEVVEYRRLNGRPYHSPPHWEYSGPQQFLLTGTCYEHAPIIGLTPERMTEWENSLLALCEAHCLAVYAWCVLPNHYHVVLRAEQHKTLLAELGKLHGRTSYEWTTAENARGRKVWFRSFDRGIKSHRHFWASVNYVNHNPVKHGYVAKWQEWPWSSAADYLERVGTETAQQIWTEFPVLDYGKTWDVD